MQQHRSWMRTAITLPAVLLVTSTSSLQAQDFEGIITAKVKDTKAGEMKTYVKGGRIRMEMTVPGQGSIAIIPDPAAGETYIVMPAQSMYMVMKMSDAEKMVDSALHRGGTEAEPSATGRKDMIAGHSCEYFRFRDAKSATDICMAAGMGALRGGASMFTGGMPGRGRPAAPPPWAKEMTRKGMFPLKVADTTGVMIWEVIALDPKKLDASLFAPPAGFQKMTMPTFGKPPQ